MKRLLIIMMIAVVAHAFGQENKEGGEKRTIAAIANGYESIAWGTKLSDARDKIKGKLVFSDDRTKIISRDGDLEYYYGFFYVDPALAGAAEKKEAEAQPADSEKVDEGTLFYVALKFPYLSMEEVRKKIEDRYGPSTNENLHKMQGAIAWNGESTIIIMWVDRYENRPFCRRITYIDKKITRELSEYQFKVFNKVELAILKQLGI
ncbi:MAG: hypothetical protein JXA07_06210 [Spirochaetes bacterium]|nr:hypothetical protein [Spirochaetota bacterium]